MTSLIHEITSPGYASSVPKRACQECYYPEAARIRKTTFLDIPCLPLFLLSTIILFSVQLSSFLFPDFLIFAIR